MATENAKKQGFGAKFMQWYESYSGKKAVGAVYSLGAAVVIIGAMFKILHLQGAGIMLGAGMITEAILFTIGVFDKPHVEFHWENVFPQLYGNGEGILPEVYEEVMSRPQPTLLGAGVAGGATPAMGVASAAPKAAAEDPAVAGKVPTLKDEDLKALKDGIADLAKTATQFSELGKVAQSGVKLNEKLAAAEVATESYTNATATLAQSYAQVSGDMQQVATQTSAYKASVEQVGQKLASLNSVYELQLQAVNAQVEAQKSITASTKEAADKQIAFAKEAAEAQAAFATGAKQLQKQVADLNAVYGNMLNALA